MDARPVDDGWMIPPEPVPGILAGYHLVRRLGSGTRADVFLGSSGAGHEGQAPRTAAVKVFRAGVGVESVEAELEALCRGSLPHCASLLDVASSPTGLPVAVLGRVERGSVGQLLRERRSVEAGEAVTLLAPLALLLNPLHENGVAHTAIGATKVHLTEAGEPVLIGFGDARLLSPSSSPAARDAEAAVRSDRELLARLAVIVLDHVRIGGGSAEGVVNWIRETDRLSSAFAPELAERLFSLAEPLPIAFARPSADDTQQVPARIGTSTTLPVGVESHDDTPAADHGASSPTDAQLPSWVREFLADLPLAGLRERVRDFVGSIRRRVWLLALAGAFAVVAAVATSAPSTGADESEILPGSQPAGEIMHSSQALPEDPVLALAGLLEARERCIRDLSVLCLDGVDQLGSSAMADDTLLIKRIVAGEEQPEGVIRPLGSPELVERLGDTALVRFGPESDPASVLMIRSEAGWRIRAFLGA